MRVSSTQNGRMIVALSAEDRAYLPGPYAATVSEDGTQVVVYKDPGGNQGYKRGNNGEWGLDFQGDAFRKLNPFGVVTVKAVYGVDKIVAKLPEALPPLMNRGASKRAKPQASAVSQPAPRRPLAELVAEINDRRQQSPDNMVFSVDADGYLKVMVEYGRG